MYSITSITLEIIVAKQRVAETKFTAGAAELMADNALTPQTLAEAKTAYKKAYAYAKAHKGYVRSYVRSETHVGEGNIGMWKRETFINRKSVEVMEHSKND